MIIRIQQGFPYPTKVRPFSHELVQNILWLGRGSYMADADLDIHKAAANVLVGNYCSIAHEVVFCLRHEHDYGKLTTFPVELLDLEDVMQDRESEHILQTQLGNQKDQIIIGHDVWIGRGAVLMGGVHIGNGAVVGAHAVVAKDVPPYAVVVGNPARVIKYRFPADVIEKLQAIKWWYWPKEQVQALAETEDMNAFLQAHYSPVPFVEDEMTQLLQRLKEQGKAICIFSPVMAEGDALACRHVLEEYAGRFRKNDGIALFVELDGNGETVRRILEEVVQGHKDMPQVFLCQKKENAPLSLLQHADYLITTRNFRSLIYFDYGMDYGVKRLYGLSEDVFSAPITLEQKKEIVEAHLQKKRIGIDNLLKTGRCDEVMGAISSLASLLYNYNQEYTDDFLENCLMELKEIFGTQTGFDEGNKKLILFYDGFGMDTRGLAQIYLDGIGALGYRILYLAPEKARGKIPTLEGVLEKYEATIVYYPEDTKIHQHQSICETIGNHHPKIAFLYTTPWDVAGILAFMRFENSMRRYQVNLTDHAFWLGRNAFDWCLEFREYGASISMHYRRIPKEKLMILPYYPVINKEFSFEGFPFNKQEGDFVIFSGGTLYKTMDTEKTYYRIVAYCLENHPQVKFWYAGTGDDRYLRALMAKYPGRVFYTEERKDLFAVLRHVDMYLNTYPLGGGLMMQYSAVAGRAPMTLRVADDAGSGVLLGQENLGIVFDSIGEMKEALSRFITDVSYRKTIEENIRNAVIKPEEFRKRLEKFLQAPSAEIGSLPSVHTEAFRRGYLKRFIEKVTF